MYAAIIEKMRVDVRGRSDATAVVCIYVHTHSNSVKCNVLKLKVQEIF